MPTTNLRVSLGRDVHDLALHERVLCRVLALASQAAQRSKPWRREAHAFNRRGAAAIARDAVMLDLARHSAGLDQRVVGGVLALGLARGAQVKVRADSACEVWALDGLLLALVAKDAFVLALGGLQRLEP
jgi:hypothetical protein